MSSEAHNKSAAQLTILQVLPALKVGGVERGTVEFAIYLKQQGYKPIIVSAGGALVAELNNHQITHLTMNVGKKSPISLLSVKKLQRVMLDWKVDIVHARSRLPAWLCYWAIKRIKHSAKPRFVTTLHGLHSVSRYSSIMARGDAVIAVSETAKSYLIKNFNDHFKFTSPELIYRGIDKQFDYGHQVDPDWLKVFRRNLPNGQAYKTVLMPGRLTQVKGVEHLILWLKSTTNYCKLVLTAEAKESSYSQKIQALFEHHQLSDRIVWLGVERAMADLYASVDLVVSVNKKAESFGRAVLEALSVGTPVVAFAHGGVAEIMTELYPEGQVKAGDEVELAKRIDAFLIEPPKVQAHNKFTNRSMFEKTTAVYKKLVSLKNSSEQA